ncbi:hypothetical protein GOODEAATRI_011714 [Goodea atripinnis]|uniref:Protein kinase domain-containing protein n=1 Tax=Goodea atripinnis TaxID=208336 RepID=A0ABV0N9W5_9TELE
MLNVFRESLEMLIMMLRKWSFLGHIRLADFGLSRRLERGGRAFTICGTIQYMAPEVLSGGPYNHAADWWSLGILLFTMATGKVILELRERPDRAAKARRGLTLSLLPLKGFDFDSMLSPAATPDTLLDGYTRTAVPLPGPSLQPPQEKAPRREVFV